MNDFTSAIKRAIESKQASALVTVAHEFNELTDKATPIWTGRLQRSKRVSVESPTVVYAVMGNEKTPYLFYQYFGALRHRGNFTAGLQDLTALYRDGGASSGGSTRRTERAGSNAPRKPSQRPRGAMKSPRVKPPEAALTPRVTGKGAKALYGRAYRLALKHGQLTKLDAPRPYERGAEDPVIVAQLTETFSGVVFGGVK
jgi:hypothetical protein